MNPIRFLISLGLLGLAACGDSGAVALPERMHLLGEARSSDGGLTLECGLDYVIELESEEDRGSDRARYRGQMGGEAGRVVLDAQQAGWSLIGDAFSQVRVVVTEDNGLEIMSLGLPAPANPSRPSFWEGVADFEGVYDGGGRAHGIWTCAPFYTDLGGFADTAWAVSGTWRIEPFGS